jgi:hypothetical protein
MADEHFAVLSNLINILYKEIKGFEDKGPIFSFYRLMATLWRRIVLDPFRYEIHDIILQIFQSQRKRIGSLLMISDIANNSKDYDTEYLLIKYVLSRAIQAIIDFGVNEYSVHFLQHSKFVPIGYGFIHEKVIRLSRIFYEDIAKLSREQTKVRYQSDFELVQKYFLPCTWIEVYKIRLECELQQMRNGFFYEFKEIRSLKPSLEESYPLLYTSFGKSLFLNDSTPDCTKRIKLYIDFLYLNNRMKEIEEYNFLVTYKQQEDLDLYSSALVQDEELEYVNKRFELFLEKISGFKLSTWEDARIEEV